MSIESSICDLACIKKSPNAAGLPEGNSLLCSVLNADVADIMLANGLPAPVRLDMADLADGDTFGFNCMFATTALSAEGVKLPAVILTLPSAELNSGIALT